jgi:predicted nucleic acid-binding protein
VLGRIGAASISADLIREGPTVMPAHFEADTYAGLRRMATTHEIARQRLPAALTRLASIVGERIALALLLPAAYQLFDHVGAHDSFYLALALSREAKLLTADAPLARAAVQLGAAVIFRPPEAIG